MTERDPAPEIPGFSYVDHIGRGGFADVYLYEQHFPSRNVAVKVLDVTATGSDELDLEQFRAEANVMAQLSGHPSIVPIFGADVSPSGHPFIVMEYCPPPALGQRYRREPFSTSEALDIGVRISSAVETAHRVGILHRDIKPPNILMSSFGVPKLTDFGIAGAAGADPDGSSYGVSVPWAAPEMFDDVVVHDVRSDVWALAATIYTLLAGRSPFEAAGLNNDNSSLMHRIQHQELTYVNRQDVPNSLEELLRDGMAKRLEQRPSSAIEFAQGMQRVQEELGLPVTWAEVFHAAPDGEEASVELDQRTRLRPVAIVVPDLIAEHGTRLRPRVVTAQPLPSPARTGLAAGKTGRGALRRSRIGSKVGRASAGERDSDVAALEAEIASQQRTRHEAHEQPIRLSAPVISVLLVIGVCIVLAIAWFTLGGGAAA